MKNILIILFLCVVATLGQLQWAKEWNSFPESVFPDGYNPGMIKSRVNRLLLAQRARVRHHTEFYSKVIQETIYELEKRGFSSLTLLNITQNVNLQIYKFVVNGTVIYTNGFLVSMQKIDVTAMGQSVNIPTIDGVPTPRATVSGTLNFRDAKLGYDVIFNGVNGEVNKFTGDITHTLISWPIGIRQNLTTNEITVDMSLGSITTTGITRMVYRPANSTTEVISRQFLASQNFAGVRTWVNIIAPIILDVIKNKVPFPDICYNHC